MNKIQYIVKFTKNGITHEKWFDFSIEAIYFANKEPGSISIVDSRGNMVKDYSKKAEER